MSRPGFRMNSSAHALLSTQLVPNSDSSVKPSLVWLDIQRTCSPSCLMKYSVMDAEIFLSLPLHFGQSFVFAYFWPVQSHFVQFICTYGIIVLLRRCCTYVCAC